MRKVLQCPRCGAKHPLTEHAGVASFSCSECGRTLKVPQEVRSSPARPGDDETVVDRDASTAVHPSTPPPRRARAAVRASAQPGRIWRLLAWVVGLFAGGLIVFVGGRAIGYLSGQRALDIVISSGFRRYTVLLPIVPVWAVLTTLLVTLLLDGGAAWSRRRSERAAEQAAAPVPDDPPRPRRTSEGRRTGSG